MGSKSKSLALLVIAFILALSIFPVQAQVCTFPSTSFLVLAYSADVGNGVTAGTPFGIGIFDMSNGIAALSVQGGTITPSSIVIANGYWVGNVTVTDTDSAVITVTDSQGQTSTMLYSIPILSPTPLPTLPSPTTTPTQQPTPNPTSTPTIPEFSAIAIPMLFIVMVTAGLLVYFEKYKQRRFG